MTSVLICETAKKSLVKFILRGMNINLFSSFSAFFTVHNEGEFDIAIRIYRGIFLFVLVTFLLAVNTWGWRKAGVNHVLIFELDPRDHLSYQQLLEVMTWSEHCSDIIGQFRTVVVGLEQT